MAQHNKQQETVYYTHSWKVCAKTSRGNYPTCILTSSSPFCIKIIRFLAPPPPHAPLHRPMPLACISFSHYVCTYRALPLPLVRPCHAVICITFSFHDTWSRNFSTSSSTLLRCRSWMSERAQQLAVCQPMCCCCAIRKVQVGVTSTTIIIYLKKSFFFVHVVVVVVPSSSQLAVCVRRQVYPLANMSLRWEEFTFEWVSNFWTAFLRR